MSLTGRVERRSDVETAVSLSRQVAGAVDVVHELEYDVDDPPLFTAVTGFGVACADRSAALLRPMAGTGGGQRPAVPGGTSADGAGPDGSTRRRNSTSGTIARALSPANRYIPPSVASSVFGSAFQPNH